MNKKINEIKKIISKSTQGKYVPGIVVKYLVEKNNNAIYLNLETGGEL